MRPARASSRTIFLLMPWALVLWTVPALSSVLDLGPTRAASLPGRGWLPRQGSSVRLGVAQPVAMPGVRLSWAGADVVLAAPLSIEVRVADLRAGMAVEQGTGVAFVFHGAGVLLGAGIAGESVQVEGTPGERRLRADVRIGFSGGPFLLAARWEGPTRASSGAPRATVEIVLHLEQSRWSMGVSRRSSRFGEDAIWSGGFGVALHPRFALSSRFENEATEIGVRARRGPFAVGVFLPVSSPVGAGPAAVLEWTP